MALCYFPSCTAWLINVLIKLKRFIQFPQIMCTKLPHLKQTHSSFKQTRFVAASLSGVWRCHFSLTCSFPASRHFKCFVFFFANPFEIDSFTLLYFSLQFIKFSLETVLGQICMYLDEVLTQSCKYLNNMHYMHYSHNT